MNNARSLKHMAFVCAVLALVGCASPTPRSASSLPAPIIAPVVPVFDALEGKLIDVGMSKASISQILGAFADAGNLNLIVDPRVLKGGQLADMHLRQVTLRGHAHL